MSNEIERGRKMLREYLNSQNDCLSVRTRNHLFKLFEENYIDHMEGDPDYFKEISEFLNKRRTRTEKETFCFEMTRKLLKFQDVKAEYRKRWPEEFV